MLLVLQQQAQQMEVAQHTLQWSRVLAQHSQGLWVSEVNQQQAHWQLKGEALSAAQVGKLTATQFATLGTDDLAALTTAQMATVTATQINGLGSDQIQALETADLQSLRASQISTLTTDAINALSTAQTQALTTAQIAKITATQLDSLVGSKATADIAALFTSAQVGTTDAPAVLSATQLSELTTDQVAALRTDA